MLLSFPFLFQSPAQKEEGALDNICVTLCQDGGQEAGASAGSLGTTILSPPLKAAPGFGALLAPP